MAGAYYGEKGIPRSWRYRLAHRLLIEYLAERLYHLGKTVDWDKLLEFLPSFERRGFVPGDGKSRTRWPDASAELEVRRFYEILYTTGAIYPFAWSRWHYEAERLFHDPALLESADEMTLRKLLTYHARVDHFNEGHFDEMVESGHVTAILRRIKELQEH